MINQKFMKSALEIAKQSGNDIPIGAVLVKDNEIISYAHNEKEKLNQPTKHAEIIVIEEACKKLESWRLQDCTLYVTLEPCPMCTWAIIQSRIKKVVFGSYDLLYGSLGSKLDLRQLVNSKLEVNGGILEEECDNILKSYFEKMRYDNKK